MIKFNTRLRGQGFSIPTLFLVVSLSHSTILSAESTFKTIPAYCADASYPIIITVRGIRNSHGSIKAKLYGQNPDDFLVTGKKLDSKRESTQIPSTVICLEAPHPGTYAIVVHHDENGNKKLDQNWIGMPTEGVGFSNNPQLFLAPPNHTEVAFPVIDELTTVDIDLQY